MEIEISFIFERMFIQNAILKTSFWPFWSKIFFKVRDPIKESKYYNMRELCLGVLYI